MSRYGRETKIYSDTENDPNPDKKNNRNVYFCVAFSRYIYISTHSMINRLIFKNISCIRVGMYYHGFNKLARLLNIYLTEKIGQGIISNDIMDR